MKPNLFLIGAQKSGTTSLDHALRQHPDIQGGLRQEAHFFDHKWGGAESCRENYPLFPGTRWTLDNTPYYLFHPAVPDRIARSLGTDVRILVVLRDPIERAFSHYRHEIRKGRESRGPRQALSAPDEGVREECRLLATGIEYCSFHHQRYSYLERGQYIDQLRLWEASFGRDNMCILVAEELFDHDERELEECCRFLGIEHVPEMRIKAMNIGRSGELPIEIRNDLIRYFRPYNEDLADWLGWWPQWCGT